MGDVIHQQSRRSFIKGIGTAFAGAAAAGVIGGISSAAAEGSTGIEDSASGSGTNSVESSNLETSSDQNAWDEEFDVVVVGAGLAGLSAAVTVATEGNGANCLVLEKGDKQGIGNSPFSFGNVVYTNDPAAFEIYLEQLIGECTPEDVRNAYAEGTVEILPWLHELGAKDEDLKISEPGTGFGGEYAEFENGGTSGNVSYPGTNGDSHIYKFMLSVAQEHADSIELRFGTAMESVIRDWTTGEVVGVTANGRHIKADKGVIMCCGGYESDQKMLEDYTGVKAYPLAGVGNTGDGQRALMAIGADMWHMHGGAQYWLSLRDLENTRFVSSLWYFTTKEYGITVGSNGRRFYMDWDGCATNVWDPALNGTDFRCNVGYRHGITQFGGEWNHLPMPSKGWFIFDQAGLEAGAFPSDLSSDIVADGWAYSAESVEELAALIDVPADELAATVDTWNSYCENGKDEAFYRPAEHMTAVIGAPFYAMLCVPALLNTDGGAVRDAKGEVLDPLGNPILGLYSAGEFGSIWGHYYQGAGNLSECIVFGKISARSALTR